MSTQPHLAAEEGYAEGRDGTRIFWSAVGQGGPALVCCDGIGCDGFAWKYLVRDFAATNRIVRWHYRGHGRSGVPKDRTRVSFDDISSDLQAVLDRCYAAADYGPRARYEDERPNPPLRPKDAKWAIRLLRDQGLLAED